MLIFTTRITGCSLSTKTHCASIALVLVSEDMRQGKEEPNRYGPLTPLATAADPAATSQLPVPLCHATANQYGEREEFFSPRASFVVRLRHCRPGVRTHANHAFSTDFRLFDSNGSLPPGPEIGTHDGSRDHARGAWCMPVA